MNLSNKDIKQTPLNSSLPTYEGTSSSINKGLYHSKLLPNYQNLVKNGHMDEVPINTTVIEESIFENFTM